MKMLSILVLFVSSMALSAPPSPNQYNSFIILATCEVSVPLPNNVVNKLDLSIFVDFAKMLTAKEGSETPIRILYHEGRLISDGKFSLLADEKAEISARLSDLYTVTDITILFDEGFKTSNQLDMQVTHWNRQGKKTFDGTIKGTCSEPIL